jgi:8-amino-7-oxononanoate synthase
MLAANLKKRLSERDSSGLFRKLGSANGLIDFTSNDYFGLASSASLFREIETVILTRGTFLNGSTGSRLLSGNTGYAEEVEDMLARIFQAEKALIFNSGYAANLGVLSAVPQRNDTIFYDASCHASIKDGARLSLAKHHPFRHNDLDDLEAKLKRQVGHTFVVAESVYSMEGDFCPLAEMVQLTEKYDATLVLDEAHSTGVFGPGGAGLAVAHGLAARVGIRIYTFGKAMGVHGACVVGSALLQQFIVNFSRPFIYTTALPLHSLASIESAFRFLGNNIQLQEILRGRIDHFVALAKEVPGLTSNTGAIQSVTIPGNMAARKAADWLQQEGFDLRPILSPTVPVGTERLRICLHTFNSREEIGGLVDNLKTIAGTDAA